MKNVLLFARVPMNVLYIKPICEGLSEKVSFWKVVRSPNGSKQKDPFSFLNVKVKKLPSWLAPLVPMDIYLSSDIMLVGKRCRCKIYTFHGASFKGRAYTPKVLAYDKLFIIGPYMERRFIELGILKKNDSRIVRVGMPKLDALLDGTWDRKKAKEYLKIKSDLPVVLYAPTWGAGSSLEVMGDLIVDVVLCLGFSLVIKLHDHSMRDKRWREKSKEWETKGAFLLKDPDIIPAFAASDILISDLSSAANEYLILNRPIIYAAFSNYKKRYKESIDLKTWGLAAGPFVKNKKELELALKEAVEHPEVYSHIRKAMAEDLFYNPGRATEVAVNEILSLL